MRLKADLTLLLVTILWGSSFAVMRVAAQFDIIFFLNGCRFLLGGILILPFARINEIPTIKDLVPPVLAGVALFGATSFQQAGLKSTAAGNAGFITILYVVIVPIILLIGWKEFPKAFIWIAIVLAGVGGFLLSTNGSYKIVGGDLLIFIGSFFWAFHVVVVGKSQSGLPPLLFASGQYLVCGIINLVVGSFIERPTQDVMVAILPAIFYTGIISIAIGFTLQVFAQKHTPSNEAAIILSMEAVFAAIFGWIFLHEILTPIQLTGCIIILAAVILVQFGQSVLSFKSN